MAWTDLFKVFTFAFTDDPTTKLVKSKNISGAGISQPEAMVDIRSSDGVTNGMVRIDNDFINVNSSSSRLMRVKEYEKLRTFPEIEQAITVIADEACLAGETLVNTVFDGLRTISWLEKNKQDQEFLVYCWDFEKNDYGIGVAYNPRKTKKSKVIRFTLSDGTQFRCTEDHEILLENNTWAEAKYITKKTKLQSFNRLPAQNLMKHRSKRNNFPRIYTKTKGWIHERQFIDEWRLNKDIKKYETHNKISRLLEKDFTHPQILKVLNIEEMNLFEEMKKYGITIQELRVLNQFLEEKIVIDIEEEENEIDVYDLSVKHHENFCGESIIFHNCQEDKNSNIIDVTCNNNEIKEEIDWLLLNRKMLNLNRNIWGYVKNLCINGDLFLEICINQENPKEGIYSLKELPCEEIFRIESTKGTLFEFQQSLTGPDYQAVLKKINNESDDENIDLENNNIIRYTPNQIIHMRLGEKRKNFYPYGQSILEPARSPAYQLKLMEDAMVIYRLTRAPERRVFYIDIGSMPGFKGEAFMDRVKDLLRKRKVVKNSLSGAQSIDEKWAAPTADEDFWIPIRQGSNTRIETLPGASNLGEIDDTVYFKKKLYTALNFPSNYFENEDPNTTRIVLSMQNTTFAKMIERIQRSVEDGLYEVVYRHLELRGYPEEDYEDLKIKITVPSEYKELSRMEVENNRINNAGSLKGSMLMSDWDILTKILKYSEKETEEMLSRLKIQKLEDARLQIMLQNPDLLGIGSPSSSDTENPEIGTEPTGDNPTLNPDEQNSQNNNQDLNQDINTDDINQNNNNKQQLNNYNKNINLPIPTEQDIKKYNLEIVSYDKEQDYEDIDWSVE